MNLISYYGYRLKADHAWNGKDMGEGSIHHFFFAAAETALEALLPADDGHFFFV